jgi:hypothetical protein
MSDVSCWYVAVYLYSTPFSPVISTSRRKKGRHQLRNYSITPNEKLYPYCYCTQAMLMVQMAEGGQRRCWGLGLAGRAPYRYRKRASGRSCIIQCCIVYCIMLVTWNRHRSNPYRALIFFYTTGTVVILSFKIKIGRMIKCTEWSIIYL